MPPNPNLHLLTRVLNLLPDVVAFVDEEGRFVFVSNASEQVFGWRPRELVGKSLLDFVCAEDGQGSQKIAGGNIQNLIPKDSESRFVGKNGEIVYIDWTIETLEQDGLWLAIARDVTDSRGIDEDIDSE